MTKQPLILIVDDEEDLLESFSAKLQSSGFEIALASSGDEAVSKAGILMPDLILMDLNMPGLNGADAVLAIKRNTKTKNIKIAFLTDLKIVRLSKEISGVKDFLDKMEDVETIVSKIKNILNRA